ncbi:hypothetical protein C4D60_Mb07t11060 [Musa balbisiana]|uniref:Uncharacterized protein n=1 Tax=Musa balbisiana TaxID=52838 RepID=A0A4S8JEP4_MUSBA|nr:hypothetical protein C4D60_Mb07t11060 [Musa balbisiana]
MKSLRLVLLRSQVSVPRGIYSRPTVGHGVLGILSAGPRLASFAPVKASSGAAETTSVSYSTIVPGLRRDPVIYRCRFFAFLAVAGSLMGSGSTYVIDSFREYFLSGGKVILMLVEAIDIYLIGTVMLVFGMGLYELFISNLDIAKMSSYGSNLLGLFKLLERPRWLDIQSVNELKTKLGHVIVMVLLVGMFEKSKKVTISSTADLLCFAASILLSSSCLYLLSKLHTTKGSMHA